MLCSQQLVFFLGHGHPKMMVGHRETQSTSLINQIHLSCMLSYQLSLSIFPCKKIFLFLALDQNHQHCAIKSVVLHTGPSIVSMYISIFLFPAMDSNATSTTNLQVLSQFINTLSYPLYCLLFLPKYSHSFHVRGLHYVKSTSGS